MQCPKCGTEISSGFKIWLVPVCLVLALAGFVVGAYYMKTQVSSPATAVPAVTTHVTNSATTTATPSGNTSNDAQATGQYYFADNVLVAEDVRIEITDWRVIPVGEAGNEYGSAPVIAFWYNTTNLSGKDEINPTSAWIAMFTAVQDNNPDMVNELQTASLPDPAFLDTQSATIKKDGAVPCAWAYELSDTTTPVVLKATKGILGESLGEQTFNIAG